MEPSPPVHLLIYDHKAIVYIHTTNDVSVFLSPHINRQCRICIQSFYLSILICIINTTCISIHLSNWCIIDVCIHLNPKWCRKTSSVSIEIDTWKNNLNFRILLILPKIQVLAPSNWSDRVVSSKFGISWPENISLDLKNITQVHMSGNILKIII